MTGLRRVVRAGSRLAGLLSGATATVATFVLLYHQLDGHAAADWVGYLLVGSILAWWFLTRRPYPADDHDLPVADYTNGRLVIIGWAGSGLVLAGAVAYSIAIHPWQTRFDGYLALFGAALVGTELLRRHGRRPTGASTGDPSSRPSPVGWRAFPPVLRRAVYVGLAGATPILANLVAVAALWVPVTTTGLLRDWQTGWLALPVAALVWLLWALAFGWATGMYQTIIIHRHGSVHGFSYRALEGLVTRESGSWSDSVDHSVLPFRTGMSPLFRLSRTRPLWSEANTHGYGVSYTGLTYTQLRTWFMEFPPAYLPLWLRWVVARWRSSPAGD